MHWYWQNVGKDNYKLYFVIFQRSYGPWLMSEFCFHLISLEQFDGFWWNFVCAVLRLAHEIFLNFSKCCGPWLMLKFQFLEISSLACKRIFTFFVATENENCKKKKKKYIYIYLFRSPEPLRKMSKLFTFFSVQLKTKNVNIIIHLSSNSERYTKYFFLYRYEKCKNVIYILSVVPTKNV